MLFKSLKTVTKSISKWLIQVNKCFLNVQIELELVGCMCSLLYYLNVR